MRTAWRMILILALIAPFVVAPLFVVYRSSCVDEGKRVDEWSVVAPWDDPASDCRDHETGFEVLRDEVGL